MKWPTDHEGFEDSHQIDAGSDRAVAILAAIGVQDKINRLVIVQLATDDKTIDELHSREGPLHSFGMAIILAFAMGLIDEGTKNNLNTIRKIRNIFAHSYRPVTFKTTAIANAVRSLKFRPNGKGKTATTFKRVYERTDHKAFARQMFLAVAMTEESRMLRKISSKLKVRALVLEKKVVRLDTKLRARSAAVGTKHS